MTHSSKTIAAAMAATVVISFLLLPSCRGRRMSDMQPTGDTVEVVIGGDSTNAAPANDSIPDRI